MRAIDRLRHLWRALFRTARVERDLDDELSNWMDELEERHRRAGLPPAEARRRAIAEIGSRDIMKERVRDHRPGRAFSGLRHDLRLSWRALRRAPGFTSVVVLTLALGIGAATAIFSVVNAILIAPLPYRDAARLVFIWADMSDSGYPRAPLSGPELNDLRQRGTLFDGFGAIWSTTASLSGDGDPEQLRIGLVTTNFFPVLGVTAAIGRTFTEEDDVAQGPPGILLSWSVFQQRYGGDPSLVGKRVVVNGNPTTVIGVMPADFRLWLPMDSSVPDKLQAWTPLRSAGLPRSPRGQQYLRAVGRMKPGVTVSEARQQVTSIAAAISREFTEYGSAGRVLTTIGLQEDGVREVRPSLLALFGGVAILSLIACVNVANLLVARSAARRRQTALCAALGANTGRLLRQCLADGLILSGLGAAAGLGAGYLGLKTLLALRPAGLDRIATAQMDVVVILFTCGAALACGILFSLGPLFEVTRMDLLQSLQRDDRRAGGGGRYRVRAALVVVQIALGVVLLVGAGLFVRSFLAIMRVDPGFSAERALTFRIAVPLQRYRGRPAVDDFSRRLQAALAAMPGVTGVGAISHLPFDDLPNWGGGYLARPDADPAQTPNADYRAVSPGLLEALGVRVVEGQLFTEADDANAQPVIVVDDLLARRAWPGASAIGKQIRVDPGSQGSPTTMATVVGVVRHLRVRSLVADLTEQVFFPVRQALRNPLAYVVRTSGDPAALAPAVRRALAGIDPLIPIYDVRPLDDYTREARASGRFTAMLVACFAGAATLLSCVGVYGVIAYGVARRRPEFGVRLAMGARASQVVALVVREGAVLAAIGLTAGTIAAVGASRLVRHQLYGVTATDVVAYLAAIVILGAAAVLAAWIPARRAAAVSPLDALRAE
ncbi:MAG TPA: ABC transporter permease [Vicinamibacterales bacterium]|nr:ABC transporter permease [Vicinamibacterales bacterium]